MLNSGLRIIFFDMIDTTTSLWVSVVVMVVEFLISFVFDYPRFTMKWLTKTKTENPKIKINSSQFFIKPSRTKRPKLRA